MLRPIDTGSACGGQVLGQCSRSSPGTGWVGLASPPARSVAAGDAGGPARPCLGGDGAAWGDALGVRTGVLRSGSGPVMRGVWCVGQVMELAIAGMVGSVTAGCGRRGSAAKAGRSLRRPASLCPCPGFTGSGRLRQPPRSRAVWDGRHPLQPPLRRPGASAPVMAGEAPAVRRAPGRCAPAPLPSSGVSGASLPVLRKPHPRGTTQAWAGGTPRQQER